MPEGPDLQVDGYRYRAGQGTDAGSQVLRRDVAGAGTHGHERGEIGVVELQLVVQGDDAGLCVAAVRLGEPPGLTLVDADYAERPDKFPEMGISLQSVSSVSITTMRSRPARDAKNGWPAPGIARGSLDDVVGDLYGRAHARTAGRARRTIEGSGGVLISAS